jgi:hypothetical protein
VLLVFFEPQSTTISQVKYFDSLRNEPEESRQKAQAMLHVIQTAASQSTTDLPSRCNTVRQKDGWSCGYHSVLFVVENVKALIRITQPVRKINMLIEQINKFRTSLQPASVPSEPPPLPPLQTHQHRHPLQNQSRPNQSVKSVTMVAADVATAKEVVCPATQTPQPGIFRKRKAKRQQMHHQQQI